MKWILLTLLFTLNTYAIDKKVSEMPQLDAVDYASGDLFMISDISAGVSKKTPISQLDLRYLPNASFQSMFDSAFAAKDTDDLAEGSTNKYYVLATAQSDLISQVITNGVTTKAPSEDAVFDYVADEHGGLPSNVVITPLNKSQWFQSKDAMFLQQLDSATQTNTAGAYNGGGTGQKIFIEMMNYNNLDLDSLTSLSFNAKNIRDGGPANQQGNLAWNVLVNFSNGFLTTANDYAILVEDGLPFWFTLFHVISNSTYTDYTVGTSERAWKCVGGTGVINFTGNTSIGVSEITTINGSQVFALTPGMYIRKTPTGVDAGAEANMTFPDGTTIVTVDTANNKVTTSAPALVNGTTVSFKQYGGIAPIGRTGTSTASNATITAIANTADLQVNMAVQGDCITGTTYIASMVANTSITVGSAGAVNSSGTCNLTFKATGKTGIPGNAENVGIPLSVIQANNPNAYITNNAPHTSAGWAANDGGAPKNYVKMGGIQLNQGSSSITTHRLNAIKSITVNSDVYKFAR